MKNKKANLETIGNTILWIIIFAILLGALYFVLKFLKIL